MYKVAQCVPFFNNGNAKEFNNQYGAACFMAVLLENVILEKTVHEILYEYSLRE